MKRIISIILLMTLSMSLLVSCGNKIDSIQEIVFDKHDITLEVGESTKINVEIFPNKYSDTKLTWDSTNPDVAIVMNGTISAISEGKTIISATTENGKMDMCIVIVGNGGDQFNYLTSDLSQYIEFTENYSNQKINLDIAKPKDIDVDVAIMSLLNSNKNSAKWREISSGSKFTLGVGDAVDIYYRGYLLDEDGKEIAVDGMTNFGDANPYTLVLGSGSFVPGFELNMVGLNTNDTNIFTKVKTGKPKESHIAYVSYTLTIDGDANNKVTVSNARIDLSRDDINDEYGNSFKDTLLGIDIGTKISLSTTLKGKNCFYTDLVVNFVTECETKHFTVECYFPYDYKKTELRNETAYFEVYVNKVVDYTDVPEFNDEFINKLIEDKKLGVTLDVLNTYDGTNLVEKFYSYANNTLYKVYNSEYENLFKQNALDRLVDIARVKIYPTEKVDKVFDSYVKELEQKYISDGGYIYDSYNGYVHYNSFEKYAHAYLNLPSGENWRDYIRKLAEDSVKMRLVIYYLVKQENLMPKKTKFDGMISAAKEKLVNEYVEYSLNYEGKTKADFTESEYADYVESCRLEVLKHYDEEYFDESVCFDILIKKAVEWFEVSTLDDKKYGVEEDNTNNPTPDQETTNNPTGSEKDYTLGLGIVFGDITNAQINATIATVVTDANGVIVSCKIDAVQNRYKIEDKVSFTSLLTKKELGYKYNMAAFGSDNNGDGIVKEWFEQAAIFEQYVIGKTAAELKALEYQEVNDHMISKDEALLAAGCTIQIGEFVNAVVKACEDEQSMSFKTAGEIALGLGVNNADNGSTGDEFEATVKMNIDYAATVLVDGKIVATLNDAAQPQATIEDGEVTATAKLISKRELKEGYNMAAYGSDNNDDGIVLEWYQQSAAFSNYILGMTASEVSNMKTKEVNYHFISADDELLSAGCTIQITEFQAVVAEAADNAK